jgi:hypothetical protein
VGLTSWPFRKAAEVEVAKVVVAVGSESILRMTITGATGSEFSLGRQAEKLPVMSRIL